MPSLLHAQAVGDQGVATYGSVRTTEAQLLVSNGYG